MRDFFQHFAFQHPWWLLSLLLIPPLLFLRNVPGARSGIDFPSLGILSSVGTKPRELSGSFSPLLLSLALVACGIAMARPQWRDVLTARTASGIDILVALDVSESMKTDDFYEDNETGTFRHKKQRVTAAKEVIERFIEQRPDDRIGLIAFGAKPYSVCPLTLDHPWLTDRLKELGVGDLDSNGTAIGSAIAAATTRLNARDAKSKVMVLVTDGASNSGPLNPLQAARSTAPLGVRVYTIAIGTAEGRLDPADIAQPRQEYDAPVLREIARITGGEFFEASTMKSLRDTFSSIDDLEKSDAPSARAIDSLELYPWLLGSAFLLAFLSLSSFALVPLPAP
ncbi:MAG: VWA domain-containing protein [Roseibacillus sp.]|nr:VWA domain-containing protein [Roseibacillus sp.]